MPDTRTPESRTTSRSTRSGTTSTVPMPVAAALGVVPTVLAHVRRLPVRAVTLPVLAVSSALTALDNARREYDDLAERGERLLSRLRRTSLSDVEDQVEDAVSGAPVASAQDGLENVGESVRDVVTQLSARARETAQRAGSGATRNAAEATRATGQAVRDSQEAVAGLAEAAASAGRNASTSPAAASDKPDTGQPETGQPDTGKPDTAASDAVVETVERVAAAAGPVSATSHDELPLADYDHMTLGSLRGRLRSLSVDQLVAVREYEKVHADRLPVVTMLDNRIAKLATDASATPSPGGARVPAPGQTSTPGGSPVTPATAGPALNPPAGGNPAQPR